MQMQMHLWLRQQLKQRLNQCFVADVIGFDAQTSIGAAVTYRHRTYLCLACQRRLQQRGMKGQQNVAMRRGALREHRKGIAAAHCRRHRLIDITGVMTARAIDKQRITAFAQPTQQWPAPDLRFGDKARRLHCVDGKNVEPRYVIGNHQRRRIDRRHTGHMQSNGENAQKLRRPPF